MQALIAGTVSHIFTQQETSLIEETSRGRNPQKNFYEPKHQICNTIRYNQISPPNQRHSRICILEVIRLSLINLA